MILLKFRFKAVLTAVFLLFIHFVLPLLWNPKLIVSFQILLLLAGTLILLLTQPRISLTEVKENKSSDRGTTLLIVAFVSLGILFSILEWAVLKTQSWTWDFYSGLGFLAMLVGLSFRIYVIQILGRNFSATVQIKDKQELITNGPYKLLRHPSYTGAWFYFIGFGLFLQVFWGTVIFSLGLWLAYQKRINAEEESLLHTFGDQYLNYQAYYLSNDSRIMVKLMVIRPLFSHELEAYFQMRFSAAKKHNAALISKEANESGLETDLFDSNSIHIGSFANGSLIGCIRLSAPIKQKIFDPEYLCYKQELKDIRDQEQKAINNYRLPSSKFLKGKDLEQLEGYFEGLIKNKKNIAESGRFINLDESFHPRLIQAMLCYVWALNLYFNVDFCFFNTTQDHARYYKRLFNCKTVFPEISFETGATDLKYLLYADIMNLPSRQADTIKSIFDSFAINKNLVEYSMKLELVRK